MHSKLKFSKKKRTLLIVECKVFVAFSKRRVCVKPAGLHALLHRVKTTFTFIIARAVAERSGGGTGAVHHLEDPK